MMQRRDLFDELIRAKTLASTTEIGLSECADTENNLDGTLNELRTFMREFNMHLAWDDDRNGNGEIQKFINEVW